MISIGNDQLLLRLYHVCPEISFGFSEYQNGQN